MDTNRSYPYTAIKALNIWKTDIFYEKYKELLKNRYQELDNFVNYIDKKYGVDFDRIQNKYSSIRKSYKYLFSEWMPIGYYSIVYGKTDDNIKDLAECLLLYGVFVTLIDDLCDTDKFDLLFETGYSDKTAIRITEIINRKVKMYEDDYLKDVFYYYDLFRNKIKTFKNYIQVEYLIDKYIALYTDQILDCRNIRKKIKKNLASEEELIRFGKSTEQGMTVSMVGIISLLSLDNLELSQEFIQSYEKDLDVLQNLAHLQNGLSTINREIKDLDPSNPLILQMILEKKLNQDIFMGEGIDENSIELLKTYIRNANSVIENKYLELFNKLDFYSTLNRYDLFFNILFGIRNLGIQYKVVSDI